MANQLETLGTIKTNWKYGTINLPTIDNIISDSILLYGEWAQKEIDLLTYLTNRKKNPEILMVGANIGLLTIALSKILRETNGLIHSFELHPQIREVLTQNLSENNCDNVSNYNYGLSSKPEVVSLPVFKRDKTVNLGAFSLHDEFLESDLKSELRTIDSLNLTNCSLIHLDVERHEMSCIKGGINTIKKYKPDLFAEVLSVNYCRQFYNYLRPHYDYFYLYCPKAYNPENYKIEQKNIFGENREFSMIATNEKIDDTLDLFEVDSIEAVSKLYNVFSETGFPEHITSGHEVVEQKKYVVQIYVDTGHGFNEEDSVTRWTSSKISSLRVDLGNYNDILALRIDPNDKGCIVKVHSLNVIFDKGILKLNPKEMNGCVFTVGDYYFFEGNDPQFLFEYFDDIVGFQELVVEIEYLELTKDLVTTIFFESKRELEVLQELIDSYMIVDDEQGLKSNAENLVLKVVESQNLAGAKVAELLELNAQNLLKQDDMFVSHLDKLKSDINSEIEKLRSEISVELDVVGDRLNSHQLTFDVLEKSVVLELSEQSAKIKRDILAKFDRIEDLLISEKRKGIFGLRRATKLFGVIGQSIFSVGIYKEFLYSYREFFVRSNWNRLLLALRAESPVDIVKNAISYLTNKRKEKSPAYYKTRNGKIAFFIEKLAQRSNFNLVISGWLVTERVVSKVILTYPDGKELCQIERDLERVDVINQFAFGQIPLKVGFEEKVNPFHKVEELNLKIVFGEDDFELYPLSFTKEKEERTSAVTLNAFLNWEKVDIKDSSAERAKPVDIVIPIYNGFDLLKNCLKSVIENSVLKYRLILINDKSTDDRIAILLKSISEDLNIDSIIINNEKNLGFIKSVNKGYSYVDDDFIILNSDTEVTQGWLSRMMYPLKNASVASVTPVSNCATIYSFPVQDVDNDLFLEMSPSEIDSVMKLIDPENYIYVPTAVGFCMAVKYDVTEKIGLFDPIYGKGYAEENDWCCRAIELGYSHVLATNCFIYHKHGGSFTPEVKKAQIEKNLRLLNERYNDYNSSVSEWMKRNPLADIYTLYRILLYARKALRTELFIDYTNGGGAAIYSKEFVTTLRNAESDLVVVIDGSSSIDHYRLNFYYRDEVEVLEFYEVEDIEALIKTINLDVITINNLVGSTNVVEWIEFILTLHRNQSNDVDLNVLIHDFHAICPSYNLLNSSGSFCNIPDQLEVCKKCLPKITHTALFEYTDIYKWRSAFEKLLNASDSIICFSKSSSELLIKAYSEVDEKIRVVPHRVSDISKLNGTHSKGSKTVIGILGGINFQKGANVVINLCRYIDSKKLKFEVVVVGQLISEIDLSKIDCLKVTGPYKRESISALTLENNIDLFFIPSIWPETFSYTSEEVMMMELPLAVFDLGAPYERCKEYEQGIILNYRRRMEGKYLLEEIVKIM